MTDKFPFAFDMNAMTEAFSVPAFDKFVKEAQAFDFAALHEAQQKNINAIVEANKAAYTGYAAIYKRQTELFDAALADIKDRMSTIQAKPMDAEAATANFETMKAAFEKAVAEVKEVMEMAQTANTDALEILKARGEEAVAEFKVATEKFIN